MATIANLMVKIGADTTSLTRGLDNAQQKMSKFGSAMSRYVTLPIAGAGVAMVKYASDMNESLNKVDVAFGGNAQEVKSWAETTLKSYGIAEGTALDMASTFGDMSTSLGLSTKEASTLSQSLVGLAGDLSSFKNIGIDEANTALMGIFTGETESLKRLGIVMTQTNLDAYALKNGFEKTTKQMSQSELVALRYAYVMDMTSNAQGDFARTSDGFANQFRMMKESLKELAATLGENLLPLVTPLVQKFNALVQKFGALDEQQQKNILKFLGIAAAIGPVLLGVSKGIKVFEGLVKVFNLLKAHPIILIISAIAALAFLIIENWEPIKAFFIKLWDSVSAVFEKVWNWIKDNIIQPMMEKVEDIKQSWQSFKDKVSEIWTAISDWISAKWNWLVENVFNPIGNVIGTVKGVFQSFKDTVFAVFEAVRNFIVDKISAIITKISSFISKIRDAINAIKDFFSASSGGSVKYALPGGSTIEVSTREVFSGTQMATGTNYVPYDNYPALLHQGEAVIPKKYNPSYNKTMGDVNINFGTVVIREEADMKKLSKMIAKDIQRTARGVGIA